MKALILNSGPGERMRPFTDEFPKCLAKINGMTILEYQVKNLLKSGITEIIMTTGHFEDKIKSLMSEKFPNVKVEYVKNEKYRTTNYIYSLHLAKGYVDGDIILIHGDLVFDQKLLDRVIKCKNKNCVLVNNKIKLPKKDFKAEIVEGRVKRIGVGVFTENSFFLAPLYKFSKDAFSTWMIEIEKFITRGELNKYAEDAFNEVSDKIDLRPTFFGEGVCTEIDTYEDLETLKNLFEKNRKISE